MPAPDPPTAPDATDRRPRPYLPGLCVGAALIVLAYLALPMMRREVFTTADLADFHLPLRDFYGRCLAAWENPAWCPGVFCGFYLHGEGQAGMAHPLHLLLYATLPVDVGLNAEWLLNYPIAFAGMAWFLRRRGLDGAGAAFGGLLFAFCGFNLIRYLHLNYLEPFVHLPWLLASADVGLDADLRKVRRGFAALALLTASAFLCGQPQIVFFAGLVELAYLGWRVGRSPRGRGPRVAGWAVAKLVGVMIAGVQLLPTLDVKSGSVRAVGSDAFSMTFSLHPANASQFVAPYFFKARSLGDRDGTGRRWQGDDDSLRQEFCLYTGSLPWVLMAWLLVRRGGREDRKGLIAWSAVVGGVALALAFGRYTPLYGLYLKLIPFGDLFRGPTRFVGIAHFALAAVAAVGFADLADLREAPRWRRLWPILIPLAASTAVTIGLWYGARADPGAMAWVSSSKGILLGPILIGTATAGVVAAARSVRAALPALVLFAAADQLVFARDYLGINTTMGVPAVVATMAPHPPDLAPGRIATDRRPNLGLMSGHRVVGGYMALTPRRSLDYDRAGPLRIAGASWVQDEAGRWTSVADPLPRARLVARSVVSDDPGAAVGRIDPAEVVVLDEPPRPELDGGAPGEARILSDRPGSIRVATRSDGRRCLVLAESFHPGWRLAIDGREAPVLRAYGDFLGAMVGPGEHRAEFTFRPSSLRDGLALSALGLAALVALVMLPLPGRNPRT
ncbi:hypothetical protein TA3x_001010 [Tundrisphaera sp. TA3]|uniref:hypothetical protein n=1 Tax=Tundrisphaera sp. TA3 TaxID=3435775 RepID=UPI003EB6C443